MTRAHFHNLPAVVCEAIAQAKSSLKIAVCWFSHRDIFDAVLEKLRGGIPVELIIEYDSQNIRVNSEGLDFQRFINLGGTLFANCNAGLMHHKFAILDDRNILSGSFNWTYNSNAENLLFSDNTDTTAAFREEFARQKMLARRIFKIRQEEVKTFSAFPIFQNTNFHLNDLRKKVSLGTKTWVVRFDRKMDAWENCFKNSNLPFDRENALLHYWQTFRFWDETLFSEFLKNENNSETEGFQNEHSPSVSSQKREILRKFCLKMNKGDIVFAFNKKGEAIGVGIVQSEPKRFSGQGFSSFRDVQWLKNFAAAPLPCFEKVSPGTVVSFRGSALHLIQRFFEKT